LARKKARGGARPGSGPKPLPAEKRRSVRVMATFTPGEYEQLEKAAGLVPLSSFLREIALRYLARRK
jgi:hypothetical protein